MRQLLICEFGKRTLVIGDDRYEIPKEVADFLVHNCENLKVKYKFE